MGDYMKEFQIIYRILRILQKAMDLEEFDQQEIHVRGAFLCS